MFELLLIEETETKKTYLLFGPTVTTGELSCYGYVDHSKINGSYFGDSIVCGKLDKFIPMGIVALINGWR